MFSYWVLGKVLSTAISEALWKAYGSSQCVSGTKYINLETAIKRVSRLMQPNSGYFSLTFMLLYLSWGYGINIHHIEVASFRFGFLPHPSSLYLMCVHAINIPATQQGLAWPEQAPRREIPHVLFRPWTFLHAILENRIWFYSMFTLVISRQF